jgi:hypothetical protein
MLLQELQPLVDDLLPALEQKLTSEDSLSCTLEIASSLYALAFTRTAPVATVDKLLVRFGALLPDTRPDEMSQVLWACARLHFKGGRRILCAICERSARRIGLFSTDELTGMLWGAAQLKLPCSSLLDAAGTRVRKHARTFRTCELASVMHSLTKMKHTRAKKANVYHAATHELLDPRRARALNCQVRVTDAVVS